MRPVTIVSCTRGAKEETDLFRSAAARGLDEPLFFENNQAGLPACYNAALEGIANGLVAFVHDDLSIDDPDFVAKTNAGADRFAVMGLAGSAVLTIDVSDPITTWRQDRSQGAWSGTVDHRTDGTIERSYYGRPNRPCVALDGLCLIVDRLQWPGARFDPQFDFHFYDLDFCLTANAAGLPLGAIPIAATHASGGSLGSPSFREAQRHFRAKWPAGTYLPGHFMPLREEE